MRKRKAKLIARFDISDSEPLVQVMVDGELIMIEGVVFAQLTLEPGSIPKLSLDAIEFDLVKKNESDSV